MKTIKVFLASSEELEDDRVRFGNLIRKLNEIYLKRGIEIKLFEWEDYDAAYNGVSKQEEYNEQISDSDIFLALFHINAGKYTLEEFNCATEEFKKHASPKIYTYIKALAPGESESQELKTFKAKLLKDLGHYWCSYNNTDTLHLHFVMQLQLIESQPTVEYKIQENNLLLDNTPVANLENVPFVSLNKEYQRIKGELEEINDDLEDLRERLKLDHDNLKLRDRLFKKSEKRNALLKELEQNQKYLFDTAMKFTRLQGERCGERIFKAKELLDEGKAAEANAILDFSDINHDAEANVRGFRMAKEQEKAWIDNVVMSINEFELKANTIMVDETIPDMSDRCDQACKAYERAIELCDVIHYDRVVPISYDYALLLKDFNRMTECARIYERTIWFLRNGVNHNNSLYPLLAIALNDLAKVLDDLYQYKEAENAFQEALSIRRQMAKNGNEEDLANLADTLTDMAYAHFGIHQYEASSKEYDEVLKIRTCLSDKYGGKYDIDIANTFGNIALLHNELHQYKKAEYELKEALGIYRQLKGVSEEFRLESVAGVLNNLGIMYEDCRMLDEAEEVLREALSLKRQLSKMNEEKYLPEVGITLNNIANVHSYKGQFEEAEKEMLEVLDIRKHLSDKNDGALMPDIAGSYMNIGVLYNHMKRYKESEEMYNKTLEIYKNISDGGNRFMPEIADTLDNLGIHYKDQGRFEDAEKVITQALSIYVDLAKRENKAYDLWVAIVFGNLSSLYIASRQAEKAESEAKNALQIDNSQTWIYANLMTSYIMQEKYDEANNNLKNLEQLDMFFRKDYIAELDDYLHTDCLVQKQKDFIEKVKRILITK